MGGGKAPSCASAWRAQPPTLEATPPPGTAAAWCRLSPLPGPGALYDLAEDIGDITKRYAPGSVSGDGCKPGAVLEH